MITPNFLYPGYVEEFKINSHHLNYQRLKDLNNIQNVRNYIYADLVFIIASLAAVILSSSLKLAVAMSLGAMAGAVIFCIYWDRLENLSGQLLFTS